jgi:hypothetical protein
MLAVSTNTRNVEVMATTASMNGGYLRVYGAPRPPAPEVAVTSQVLFVELRFATSAFAPPVNGVAQVTTIPAGAILASGMPTWFRAFAEDGVTAILDGDIGEDLDLSQSRIISGGTFSVVSLVYYIPNP